MSFFCIGNYEKLLEFCIKVLEFEKFVVKIFKIFFFM